MDVSTAARLTTLCETAEAALREARRLLERAADRPANTPLAHIEAMRAKSAVSRLEALLQSETDALSPTPTVRDMLAGSLEER